MKVINDKIAEIYRVKKEKCKQCTEVRNGRFSSGGGILSPLQWYQSDIQKLGFPKYEIKDN